MFLPLNHLRTPAGQRSSIDSRVVIFSDFDGTISHQDSLKLLLNRFADSHWPLIERAMATGKMPESEGLQKSFDRMSLPFESAMRFVLREVKVDPHFRHFAHWVGQEGHELSILSGGFENFIRPLLAREGLGNLKLLANKVRVRSGSWMVDSCKVERLCSLCNHCKSASLVSEIVKDPNVFLVYVGDGHTDTCAIQLADLVFAKGFLARYCEEKGLAHIPFSDFAQVTSQLRGLLKTSSVSVAA